jgi:oxygen-independent coproporphyrinogen-3 oxidase
VPRHVYVHVPFCARRCSYCDFSIAVRREVPVDEYLTALEAELVHRFATSASGPVDTIYFGGGTPSRLGGDGLARAAALVRRFFPLADDGEVTAEANPEDITVASVEAWATAGVNRLSIGSQTFDDRVLEWMHRAHGADAIGHAVRAARVGGIRNLSLDLIFALPPALHRDFGADLSRLLALNPDHVSLYGLTIEPRTPVGRWVEQGLTVEQPEEGYESDFLLAHERLTAAGYEHYEVSNYAQPGLRSRHNSSYWSGVPYVGIGPAAHGFDGTSRRWNTHGYAAWRDRAMSGADPIDGQELLTADNRVAESVYLGLRSDVGLSIEAAEVELVASWVDAGWATIGLDRRLRCTATGWLRLDSLAATLTHHRSR